MLSRACGSALRIKFCRFSTVSWMLGPDAGRGLGSMTDTTSASVETAIVRQSLLSCNGDPGAVIALEAEHAVKHLLAPIGRYIAVQHDRTATSDGSTLSGMALPDHAAAHHVGLMHRAVQEVT